MGKFTPTIIATNASGEPDPTGDVALKIRQAISGSGDIDLIQTTGDTGAYSGSSDGSVLIGDATSFPSGSAGTPREKMDVEGAVRAFEFVDAEGRQISSLLNKLLPTAETLDTFSSTSGTNGSVGFDAGEAANNLNFGGIGTFFGVDSPDSDPARRGILGPGFGTVNGTLNFDVTSTANYPADSFGRAREGYLALEVNTGSGFTEVANTRADLEAGSIGSDSIDTTGTGTSSGFVLSASNDVTFSDGTDFDGDQYRTGTWQVDESDISSNMSNGYFAVRVVHYDTGGSPVIDQTNNVRYIYDNDDRFGGGLSTVSFSNTGFINPSNSGIKRLSGVTFHQQVTADAQADVSNVYYWTYDTGNAITFPTQSNCEISPTSIPTPSSVADVVNISQQATAGTGTSIDFLIDEGFTAQVQITDPVESPHTSGTFSDFQFLVDATTGSSETDTDHRFELEDKRVKNNVSDWGNIDVGTGGANEWDSTEAIAGGTASSGYDDGLQVVGGQLVYPTTDFRQSAIPNGPINSDRNYSSATGVRRYIAYSTNPTPTSNFSIEIYGTGNLVSTTATGSMNINAADEFHFEIRVGDDANGGTGWLDITKAVVTGDLDDGDGAYASGIAQNDDFSLDGQPIGVTTQTVSTSDHQDYMIFRITYGDSTSLGTPPTVEINRVNVNWDA